VGEKGIRHETAKKLASEANRAVGKGAVGREKGGGALPTSTLSPPQTSARFASLANFFFFFFFAFSPHFGAWSRVTFTADASLIYIRSRFGSCLYRKI